MAGCDKCAYDCNLQYPYPNPAPAPSGSIVLGLFDNFGTESKKALMNSNLCKIADAINSIVAGGGSGFTCGALAECSLADFGDVTLSSPTNGQVLTYNGSAWVNANAAGGGGGVSIAFSAAAGTPIPASPTVPSASGHSEGDVIVETYTDGTITWYDDGGVFKPVVTRSVFLYEKLHNGMLFLYSGDPNNGPTFTPSVGNPENAGTITSPTGCEIVSVQFVRTTASGNGSSSYVLTHDTGRCPIPYAWRASTLVQHTVGSTITPPAGSGSTLTNASNQNGGSIIQSITLTNLPTTAGADSDVRIKLCF